MWHTICKRNFRVAYCLEGMTTMSHQEKSINKFKISKPMNTKEVPVLLLTGYLGSGKTTLLNKILATKKGIKFAVIVTDIGEVNIDAALI